MSWDALQREVLAELGHVDDTLPEFVDDILERFRGGIQAGVS